MEAIELLEQLSTEVTQIKLPYPLESVVEHRQLRQSILDQLQDYILPRIHALHAPLLAVVGGSTGAGKSTLVNALAGYPVTRAGAIRPTTRQPILLHHSQDTHWFDSPRILPGLARIHGTRILDRPAVPTPASRISEGGQEGKDSLVLVSADAAFGPGLALLDAPDIDSISEENRQLANQLLAAADLWIFVTTANRYADAVPWQLLHQAAQRQITLAVVLDRVPAEVSAEVSADLQRLLREKGLADAQLFVLPETTVDEYGMIDPAEVSQIKQWLTALARDTQARQNIARKTLGGVLAQLSGEVLALNRAQTAQQDHDQQLRQDADDAYHQAQQRINQAAADGSLLRGEVLQRWQDFVGTGEFMRGVQSSVARMRDRLQAFFSGQPQPVVKVEEAIESGLYAVVVAQASQAGEELMRRWMQRPSGQQIFSGHRIPALSAGFNDAVVAEIRGWQKEVLALIEEQGAAKRTTARLAALGINGAAVALMIVAFASTAGLTGVELGIAGGAAALGQKTLETIFGDEAVRALARQAQQRLEQRCQRLLDGEKQRFLALLPEYQPSSGLQQLAGPLAEIATAMMQQGGGHE